MVHTRFDEHRTGKAGELVPLLVEDILSGRFSF